MIGTEDKKELHLPKDVLKNVLDYCGEPLPKNRKYCAGFNQMKEEYFWRAKNGEIRSGTRSYEDTCKGCKEKFTATGYQYCRKCYEDMDNMKNERKCSSCKNNFLPKVKWAFECGKCYYKNKNQTQKGKCLLESDSDED